MAPLQKFHLRPREVYKVGDVNGDQAFVVYGRGDLDGDSVPNIWTMDNTGLLTDTNPSKYYGGLKKCYENLKTKAALP